MGLICISETLFQACENCGVYDGIGDVAARVLTRIQMAAAEGRPRVDVNQRRQLGTDATMLMLAARAGDERVCTHLLMAKADVTLQDADGRTAAEYAAAGEHAKVAALLDSAHTLPLAPL